MNYAFLKPSCSKNVMQPKHKLICKINSYDDMGHLMYSIKFENNTKRLNNFDQIKSDIQNVWKNNIFNLIEERFEIHNGYGYRFHNLKDKNIKYLEKTLKYHDVDVKVILTYE